MVEIIGEDTTSNTTSETTEKELLNIDFQFVTPIYSINKPEWIEDGRDVISKYIEKRKSDKDYKENPIYPICQTEFMSDEKMNPLMNYIAATAWNLLDENGYKMDLYYTYVMDFWGQSLDKHAMHIEHVHNLGAQYTGFYFLDVPENSSNLLIFDPRPGKKQIGLVEKDMSQVTLGTSIINYKPKPGDLYLIPSWLGHGFSPNASDEAFRFIHFNVSAQLATQQPNGVEVV
jgi:hypothetical protein